MLLADYPQEVERHSDVAVVTTDSPRPLASRLCGLDGLRAIAIIAVLLFHADFYWARGGYLGVDLFFVISGFLITGLLAREIQATGRLGLGQFYWRRAKRLLPAAWLMTATVIVVASGFANDALPRLRGDATASLVYLTNWELLRTHASYFEATGRPPLLQHLWSLAIEEQFYIVWAPLVLLALPRIGRRGLSTVAVMLAAISAAWMATLAMKLGYPDQGDPSRLYFGTDTHGFPLLLGAALGLAWRPDRTTQSLGAVTRGATVLLGLLALASMAALFACLGEATAWLYPGGFLLAAAASVILVATATHPGTVFGHWLDSGLLRWIGERSYGIYLWHWPVFMLTRPDIDLRALDANTILLLRMALTIGIAAFSYRYVEAPIRHGALERLWREKRVAATGITMALLLTFGIVGTLLWHAPTQARPAQDVRAALDLDATTIQASTTETSPPAVVESTAEALTPVEAPLVVTQPDQPPVKTFTGQELTAVGDSVLLGSSRLLKVTLREADVHATMGWQAVDVIKQLKALSGAGSLRPVVLVHLGTNGYVTEAQLRQILALLADCKRVVLVNSHVPRRWMETNNALIDRVAPDFPNVVTVRWSDVSEGQPDYFVSDGVHLTEIGQRAFIAEIMRVGHLVPGSEHALDPASIDASRDYATGAGDLSPTLVRAQQAAAADAYWQKMARCETDANWQNGGRHSGGLGITPDDWKTWGGAEFAPTPAEATPAQQIEVANRISTQGWTSDDGSFVKPIGFTGWRCVVALGRPPTTATYTYTPESVLAQSFHLGERGEVVRDLQLILGLPRDGIYNKGLRKKHLAYLKQKGLPETLAGTPP